LVDAQAWARGKSLSNLDYQFLGKSEELDRQEVQQSLEAQRAKEVEARLIEQQKRLNQERKTARLQRLVLGVISFALLLSSSLGVISFWQYRKAKLSEIHAIATSSQALFASQQRFDALIAAIQAKRKQQQFHITNPATEAETNLPLLRAIYGANEYNRLLGHQGGVSQIQFSPEGEMIISASFDTTVKLWQTDGSLIQTLTGVKAPILEVAISPDGQRIAAGSGDGKVTIWQRDRMNG